VSLPSRFDRLTPPYAPDRKLGGFEAGLDVEVKRIPELARKRGPVRRSEGDALY
jgi:hypothetical protein